MENEGNTDQQQQTTQGTDQTQQTPPPTDRTVPYDRFKAVNDRVRSMEQQIADLSKTAGDADALRAQLDAANTANLRNRVALTKGLPSELADRLQGKDEAEMTADADKLLAFVRKPAAPKLDGNTGNTEAPVFTNAQIADRAFYVKNRDAIMQAVRDGRVRD